MQNQETGLKFGFTEEIQDTEIQDTRYGNESRRKGFCISCIFVSLYLVTCISPLNRNLQISHSYIASILSKCFKNWAGRDLMKVSVREAARFQLRESEIMPLTWPFQRLM